MNTPGQSITEVLHTTTLLIYIDIYKEDEPTRRTSTYERPFTREGNYLVEYLDLTQYCHHFDTKVHYLCALSDFLHRMMINFRYMCVLGFYRHYGELFKSCQYAC